MAGTKRGLEQVGGLHKKQRVEEELGTAVAGRIYEVKDSEEELESEERKSATAVAGRVYEVKDSEEEPESEEELGGAEELEGEDSEEVVFEWDESELEDGSEEDGVEDDEVEEIEETMVSVEARWAGRKYTCEQKLYTANEIVRHFDANAVHGGIVALQRGRSSAELAGRLIGHFNSEAQAFLATLDVGLIDALPNAAPKSVKGQKVSEKRGVYLAVALRG
ncbi:MAG: hypothetical protein M1819_005418 [Sarea resinae]|nr:MAG: hypothetical protein M1819_005418 [Sarea resinae]